MESLDSGLAAPCVRFNVSRISAVICSISNTLTQSQQCSYKNTWNNCGINYCTYIHAQLILQAATK